MAQRRPTGLRLRKHADKSGDRNDDGSWPFAGLSIVDDQGRPVELPPKSIVLTPSKITEGISEGWLTAEGANPVIRPAGPSQAVWASTHTGQPHVFIHYDRIVLHTREGDVAYNVTHQPDKYADDSVADARGNITKANSHNDRTKVTEDRYSAGQTRVDHFYVLELEG